jgi:hypothetical protein
MRIWYAPWIDKNDGFNGASYKFIEVVSRKWSFGKPESSMGGVVVPYRDSTSVSNVVSNAVASVPKTGSIMSPQQPPQGNPMPQTQLQRNKQQAVSQGMPNSLPNFDLNSGVGLSAPNYSNVPSNPFN